MSFSMLKNRINRMNPRTMEIMERLLIGEQQNDIALEVGLTQVRISQIVNSPIFKLEMKRRMVQRAGRMLEIQDNLLDGAKAGTNLYKEILESSPGIHTIPTKMSAAAAATVLALKMLRLTQPSESSPDGNGGGNGGEERLSYEERLRRVTIEEITKIRHQGKREEEDDDLKLAVESLHPPKELLDAIQVEEDLITEEVETSGEVG